MINRIEKIKKDLSEDRPDKLQMFFLLKGKEIAVIGEAEKVLELPKSMAIAVACKFLVESLRQEDSKKEENKSKKDEKI